MTATRDATIEVAGVVMHLSCRFPKPALWAEALHPGFLSTRAPEWRVDFTYVERYWPGAPPWIAENAVSDTPDTADGPDGPVITSSYYVARVGPGARIDVRLAAGFQIDGPMRSLLAWLLALRGGRLVRGRRLARGSSASLRCEPCEAVRDPELAAVMPGSGRYRVHATPFGAPEAAVRDGGLPLTGLVTDAPRPDGLGERSRAGAVARLVSCVYAVDRRLAFQASTLEWATRVVERVDVESAVPHGAVGTRGDR